MALLAENIRKRLGNPPQIDKCKDNLMIKDSTPIAITEKNNRQDGRKLRKSKYTVQFNTRVTPEFKKNLYEIAIELDETYAAILEKALRYYMSKISTNGRKSKKDGIKNNV